MILRWNDRPLEVANLYNPAYCALMLEKVAKGYTSSKAVGVPYPLAFLALPILVHRPTVALLPDTTHTKLHVWIQENQEIRVGFVDRVKRMNAFTREAIMFGLRHELLTVSTAGNIVPTKIKRKAVTWPNDSSAHMTLDRATLVGKLFSRVNDVSNVFAMFGVRP